MMPAGAMAHATGGEELPHWGVSRWQPTQADDSAVYPQETWVN